MSYFVWPTKRKVYDGFDNPRFVSDILAAFEFADDGFRTIIDALANDFWIISGMAYHTGAPGHYDPGAFYLNGKFYTILTGTNEGLYLTGTLTDTMNQPFGDSIVRPIYTMQVGSSTNNPAADPVSPVLAGNMDQYRISNTKLKADLLAAMGTISLLQSAAFLPVGITSGTVAAGDDARFGYSVSDINTLFALKANVLQKGNTTPFTPAQTYDPATKKYVDDNAAGILAKGTSGSFTSISGGSLVTISFGVTLGSTAYRVFVQPNTTDTANGGIAVHVRSKTTTGVDVEVYPIVHVYTGVTLDWIVFAN